MEDLREPVREPPPDLTSISELESSTGARASPQALSQDPGQRMHDLGIEDVQRALAMYKSDSSMIMGAATTCVMARMDAQGDFQVIPGDRPFHIPQEPEDFRPLSRTVRFIQGGRYYRVPIAAYPEYAIIVDWSNGKGPIEALNKDIPETVLSAMDSLAAQTLAHVSK